MTRGGINTAKLKLIKKCDVRFRLALSLAGFILPQKWLRSCWPDDRYIDGDHLRCRIHGSKVRVMQ